MSMITYLYYFKLLVLVQLVLLVYVGFKLYPTLPLKLTVDPIIEDERLRGLKIRSYNY